MSIIYNKAKVDELVAERIAATSKGAASGVASLDGTSKVPVAQIPVQAIADDAILTSAIGTAVDTAIEGAASDFGAPDLNALDNLGSVDRTRSNANARIDYDDANAFTDEFASLAGWVSEGLQVSGGKVYSTTVGPNGSQGAKRAMTGLDGTARVIGSFEVSANTGGGGTYVGVNRSGNDSLLPADIITAGSQSLLVGVTTAEAPSLVLNGVTTTAAGVVNPVPAGVYEVTIVVDNPASGSGQVTITASNADSSVVWGRTITVAAYGGAPNRVVMWNADSRALTGNSISPIAGRSGGTTLATSKPRGSRDGVSARWHHAMFMPGSTDLTTIGLPANADSRRPLPLIIYTHGSGESYNAITKQADATKCGLLMHNLISDGYAVISGTNGGLENWGNAAAQAAVLAQYKWVRDRFPLGPVVFVSVSMGNLVAANVIAARTVPNVVGWYGIDPVLSLSSVYANAAHTAKIRTAYGIAGDDSDYASKTAGFDPMLRAAREFRGIPVRFAASPDDTVVLKTQNTDAMLTKLTGVAKEASLFTTSGAHVATAHYNLADVRSFLARVTAA